MLLFTREPSSILAVAAAIGIGTGLIVILFYGAIDRVQDIVLAGAVRTGLPLPLFIPAALALGIVGSRALVRWGARGSEGENIPDLMHAVAARGGVLHARPVTFKTLAAALVIGTGGSVGAEGPVAVAGAAAGSRLGRWFAASPDRLKTLVGAGAAAGIAAAFNAPIAGVLFTAEKILGAYSAAAFAPVVVAAVLASVVARAAFGQDPVIRIPVQYGFGGAREIVLYVALGLATGVVSVLYTRWFHGAQRRFAPLRPWAAVALGVVAVGTLNVIFRADLWGRGHETLDLAILADRTAPFLVALAFAKLLATGLTLAAGGVGGAFTPALFIGATLGGGLGVAFADLLPAWELEPGAFALVGMAGLVAGATHAPLTALMMAFEMTGDYGLILPLLLSSALAFAVARRLHPESVYTEWLTRRGIHLSHGADAALLARLSVAECYNPRPHLLREGAPLAEMLAALRDSRQTDFPVVDGDRTLVGLVSAMDLRELLQKEETLRDLVVAADILRSANEVVTAHDSLLTALRRFGARDAAYLPVVDGRGRLAGMLSRADVFSAYERGLAESGE
jgi:CIC family chloride channel protein